MGNSQPIQIAKMLPLDLLSGRCSGEQAKGVAQQWLNNFLLIKRCKYSVTYIFLWRKYAYRSWIPLAIFGEAKNRYEIIWTDLWRGVLPNEVNPWDIWETHNVLEDVMLSETLPAWIKRDRKRKKWKEDVWFKKSYMQEIGLKVIQLQICSTILKKEEWPRWRSCWLKGRAPRPGDRTEGLKGRAAHYRDYSQVLKPSEFLPVGSQYFLESVILFFVSLPTTTFEWKWL